MTDNSEVSDELVNRVLAGDRAALEEFLLRNYDWLEGYIQRKIPPTKRGQFRPEDIIQDVYLKVFRKIDSYQPEGRGQLYSWLQTIARNTLLDALRKDQRSEVAVESDVSGGGNKGDAGDDSELQQFIHQLAVDQNPRASQVIRSRELQNAFQVALGTLPDDYRQVIESLYLNHMKIDDVAEQMNKSVDSVRGIRMRARQQLRETMSRLSRYV